MKKNDKSLPSSTCINKKKKVSKSESLRQNSKKIEHAMIEQLAYEIFEQGGEQHGRDCDDWLDAERQLLQLAQNN